MAPIQHVPTMGSSQALPVSSDSKPITTKTRAPDATAETPLGPRTVRAADTAHGLATPRSAFGVRSGPSTIPASVSPAPAEPVGLQDGKVTAVYPARLGNGVTFEVTANDGRAVSLFCEIEDTVPKRAKFYELRLQGRRELSVSELGALEQVFDSGTPLRVAAAAKNAAAITPTVGPRVSARFTAMRVLGEKQLPRGVTELTLQLAYGQQASVLLGAAGEILYRDRDGARALSAAELANLAEVLTTHDVGKLRAAVSGELAIVKAEQWRAVESHCQKFVGELASHGIEAEAHLHQIASPVKGSASPYEGYVLSCVVAGQHFLYALGQTLDDNTLTRAQRQLQITAAALEATASIVAPPLAASLLLGQLAKVAPRTAAAIGRGTALLGRAATALDKPTLVLLALDAEEIVASARDLVRANRDPVACMRAWQQFGLAELAYFSLPAVVDPGDPRNDVGKINLSHTDERFEHWCFRQDSPLYARARQLIPDPAVAEPFRHPEKFDAAKVLHFVEPKFASVAFLEQLPHLKTLPRLQHLSDVASFDDATFKQNTATCASTILQAGVVSLPGLPPQFLFSPAVEQPLEQLLAQIDDTSYATLSTEQREALAKQRRIEIKQFASWVRFLWSLPNVPAQEKQQAIAALVKNLAANHVVNAMLAGLMQKAGPELRDTTLMQWLKGESAPADLRPLHAIENHYTFSTAILDWAAAQH